MMTPSQIYSGHVTHVRHRPKRHRLNYGVFFMLLDLDELPALDARLALFAYNGAAPFAFHDADHGPRDGTSVRTWVDRQLHNAGIDIASGRVLLLCLPRMRGYVFNPLSLYFCYDSADQLRAILYEVHNTFGESHTYIVPVDDDGRVVQRHSFNKAFFVSPFIPMDCAYDMAIAPPGERVSVSIAESDTDGALLAAAFNGERRSLTDRFLASALLRYPLMTVKIIAGIHWEAFNLWRKRTPMFRHQPAPANAVSIVTPALGASNGRPNADCPAA
jgi:DUF1365 family protein